jgi:hypothetical protein
MMYSQPFDHIPLWVLFLGTVVLFIIVAEGGFRIGKYNSSHREQARKAQLSSILGGSIALVAFLLAITFNMAGSRFDARKKLVLDEAIAVETTYLRAKLLPEPFRTEFQDLLRKYVDIRVEIQTNKLDKIRQIIVKSEELHDLFWSRAVDLVKMKPTPVVTVLFIKSLNDVVDLHRKRMTAGLLNRISPTIFITLYFVAFLSMALMGYQAGLTEIRSLISGLALILAFSAVLMLVTDLERPSQKIFSVSQQMMVDLKAKISQTP